MEATIEAIENIISTEPDAGDQPTTVQPDEATMETQLAAEIKTLWSDHVRLSASRKVTSQELRQLRARLAERLHEMKSLLARPGRGGQWRSWLRERKIPRSTADRLVARYAEALGGDGNVLSGAISEPTAPTAEKLAMSVWSSLKKVLVTCGSVVQFIGGFAQVSGVPHEWREEGLMIFHAAPKVADGVTGTGVSTESAGPAPQPTEGDANPTDAPTADPNPQLPGELTVISEELPASAPTIDPARQPSNETSTATGELAVETAATPTETVQPATANGVDNGNVQQPIGEGE
jgi:hypothetical protein